MLNSYGPYISILKTDKYVETSPILFHDVYLHFMLTFLTYQGQLSQKNLLYTYQPSQPTYHQPIGHY